MIQCILWQTPLLFTALSFTGYSWVYTNNLTEKRIFIHYLLKMAEKTDKSKVDLGLLEEDDEFEEFPAEGKNLKRKFFFWINEFFIWYNLENFEFSFVQSCITKKINNESNYFNKRIT